MPEQIIIEFVADATQIQPAVTVLQKLGQISVEDAAAFQKMNSESTKSFTAISKGANTMLPTLGKVEKAVDSIAQSFIEGFQEGVVETLQDAGVTVEQFTQKLKQSEGAEKSLKQQLRQLTAELALLETQGKRNTARYQELVTQAGELQDAIGDANDAIRNAGSDTRGMDNVIGAAQGVASGFAVAQGAAALFGSQNEFVNESLLKVNAAMAILAGLQQIQELTSRRQFASLGALLGLRRAEVVATTAQTAATTAQTAATTGATIATRIWNTVLKANPIFLLLGVIVAVVGAMKLFSSSAEDTKDKLADLNSELERQNFLLSTSLRQLNTEGQIRMARLKEQGATEARLHGESILQFAREASEYRKSIVLRQRELQAWQKNQYAAINSSAEAEAQLNQIRRRLADENLKEQEKNFLEGSKVFLEALQTDFENLEKTNASIRVANAEFSASEAEKRRQEADKAAKDAEQKAKERTAKQREINQKNAEADFELLKMAKEKEIAYLNAVAESPVTYTVRKTALIDALNEELSLIIAGRDKQLSAEGVTERQRVLINAQADEAIIQKRNDYNARIIQLQQALRAELETAESDAAAALSGEVQKQIDILDGILANQKKFERPEQKSEEAKNRAAYEQGLIDKEAYELKKQEISDKYRRTDLERDIANLNGKLQIGGLTAEQRKQLEEELSGKMDELYDADVQAFEDKEARKVEATRKRQEMERQLVQAGFQVLGEISGAFFEGEAAQRQAAVESQLSQLATQREQELSNKNLTETQKKQIEDRFRRQEATVKRNAWMRDRDAKASEALIQGALNILKVFPNPLLMALATITTGISYAKIKGQSVPQFARGTKNAPRGYAWVGEEGPELVQLSGGEKIWSYTHSKKIGGAWNSGLPYTPEQVLSGYVPPSVDPELIANTYVNGSGQLAIDYEKLGRAIAKYVPEPVQNNLSIDKNGLNHHIQQAGSRTKIMNQRYKMN